MMKFIGLLLMMFWGPIYLAAQCNSTFSVPNTLCVGDSVLFQNNSTAATTYQWWVDGTQVASSTDLNYIFNNAGAYNIQLIAIDGACQDTSTATVSVNNNPQLMMNANPASCHGLSDGAAFAVASGTAAPYSYQWSNGASNNINPNISAGTYSVTVTDQNACTTVDSTIVIEPLALNPQVSVDSQILCGGAATGVATVTLSTGFPPFSYAWSSGEFTATATALSGGLQTVTVLDANNCIATDTFAILELNPPILSNAVINNVSISGNCDGTLSISPSGGSGSLSFTWFDGNTTDLSLDSLCEGIYSISIFDTTGCFISDTLSIGADSSVAVFWQEIPELKYYPNPILGDDLYIEGLNQGAHYRIFGLQGREWSRATIQSTDQILKINTNAWPKGLYFLEIETHQGLRQTLKVLKT